MQFIITFLIHQPPDILSTFVQNSILHHSVYESLKKSYFICHFHFTTKSILRNAKFVGNRKLSGNRRRKKGEKHKKGKKKPSKNRGKLSINPKKKPLMEKKGKIRNKPQNSPEKREIRGKN